MGGKEEEEEEGDEGLPKYNKRQREKEEAGNSRTTLAERKGVNTYQQLSSVDNVFVSNLKDSRVLPRVAGVYKCRKVFRFLGALRPQFFFVGLAVARSMQYTKNTHTHTNHVTEASGSR